MEGLPPVILGVSILIPFGLAFAVRPLLEKRYVLNAAPARATKRQFTVDLSLPMAAGTLVVVYNSIALGFPLGSGLSLLLGCLIFGFFLALDTALARERQLIQAAVSANRVVEPPQRLYPMTRRFSMVAVAATLCVTLVISMVILRDFAWLSEAVMTAESVEAAQRSVLVEVLFIMVVLLGMVINLIISYSMNLRLLFHNETQVLEQVSNGDLSRFVPVTTNDEFGFIAGHTNTMIRGLRHRSRLVNALKVAEEVQQNLLPHRPPQRKGVQVAGVSQYCDETGGDYFDYLELPGHRLGIIVADAADHGIGSALHMATARAFMRFAAHHYSDPATLMEAVNRDLTRDSAASGRFITAFFLEIDVDGRRLRWSRAGHEPALLFNPQTAAFSELDGKGIALGVSDTASYRSAETQDWPPGSVILIGTDGIHEARNVKGDYFGHERLKKLIAQHHQEDAETLKNRILEAVDAFREGFAMEDDLTLVAIKLR
ncbi:MAG: SpoIIE family protein phosphatase [Desulfosarcinaceae bacterium]|nr:SpoIIE family protein phosphatase [Desulfosarcinaceae bacterium]